MNDHQEQTVVAEPAPAKSGIPPIHQVAKKIRAMTNDVDVAAALRALMDDAVHAAMIELAARCDADDAGIRRAAIRDAVTNALEG